MRASTRSRHCWPPPAPAPAAGARRQGPGRSLSRPGGAGPLVADPARRARRRTTRPSDARSTRPSPPPRRGSPASPPRAEAWFYLGASYGARAQWRSMRGEQLAAARDGKRIKESLERAVALDPSMHDARFGVGLYQYYADVAPRPSSCCAGCCSCRGRRMAGLRDDGRGAHAGAAAAERGRLSAAPRLPVVRAARPNGRSPWCASCARATRTTPISSRSKPIFTTCTALIPAPAFGLARASSTPRCPDRVAPPDAAAARARLGIGGAARSPGRHGSRHRGSAAAPGNDARGARRDRGAARTRSWAAGSISWAGEPTPWRSTRRRSRRCPLAIRCRRPRLRAMPCAQPPNARYGPGLSPVAGRMARLRARRAWPTPLACWRALSRCAPRTRRHAIDRRACGWPSGRASEAVGALESVVSDPGDAAARLRQRLLPRGPRAGAARHHPGRSSSIVWLSTPSASIRCSRAMHSERCCGSRRENWKPARCRPRGAARRATCVDGGGRTCRYLTERARLSVASRHFF